MPVNRVLGTSNGAMNFGSDELTRGRALGRLLSLENITSNSDHRMSDMNRDRDGGRSTTDGDTLGTKCSTSSYLCTSRRSVPYQYLHASSGSHVY